MTHEEITEILKSHAEWLRNSKQGKRADLRDANLRGADLRGADLRHADLRHADLSDADLRHADLRYADLRHADLRYADLRYADLRGADLRGANLRGADLRGATLSDADLCGADLWDADLGGVKGVIVASCHWTYHGEQGRQVNAMLIDNTIMFFCGCFMGDELKLRQYIKNGDPSLQGSRLKALDFLLTCFEPTE